MRDRDDPKVQRHARSGSPFCAAAVCQAATAHAASRRTGAIDLDGFWLSDRLVFQILISCTNTCICIVFIQMQTYAYGNDKQVDFESNYVI